MRAAPTFGGQCAQQLQISLFTASSTAICEVAAPQNREKQLLEVWNVNSNGFDGKILVALD
jgi:hypothetical protein